jgi:DNA-binding LacI/PurR family transcriptional regulator
MPKLAVKTTPKYQQLAGRLREEIGRGRLKPGDRLPSLSELKAEYGISQATMERVHASLEQDGLIVRHQGRGTFVAEPTVRARTGIVGITGLGFVKERGSLYWLRVLEGMQSVAVENALQILLVDDDPGGPGWAKTDAVITTSPFSLRDATAPPVPVVELMTREGFGDAVLLDEYSGGYLAARHLIDLGHRRIAMLANLDYQPSTRREAGYRTAMAEADLPVADGFVRMIPDLWPDFYENGRTEMRRWLAEDWDALGCTALLAHNDPSALGAIETLRERGVGVPEDVSVVGYDGTGLFDFAQPRLTTIVAPLFEAGRTAMEQAVRRLRGDTGEFASVVVPITLRVADSTAPPRDPDEIPSKEKNHAR